MIPRAKAFRLVGPGAEHARGRIEAPSGATYRDDADAYAVALGPEDVADVASVARAIPAADELPNGTLVMVLGAIVPPPSLANRLLAAFGRGRTIPRAPRCGALLARGYVDIGAALDERARLDLAWGYAPVTERDSGP